MKRIFFSFIGLILIVSDVLIYFKAQSEGGVYLLLFGVGSAIFVPVGVGLITYAFGDKQREAVKKLTKIPEIEELIERAETQEQKIEILKDEYTKLQTTIQSESERLALTTRKEELEKNAKRILEELSVIDIELQDFNESVKDVPAKEVQKLRERIQAKRSGDLIIRIGASQFLIEHDQIIHMPFFGYWFYTILKLVDSSKIKWK